MLANSRSKFFHSMVKVILPTKEERATKVVHLLMWQAKRVLLVCELPSPYCIAFPDIATLQKAEEFECIPRQLSRNFIHEKMQDTIPFLLI